MADDQDGHTAPLADRVEQVQHVCAAVRVKRAGGLVAEQQPGVVGQRPGEAVEAADQVSRVLLPDPDGSVMVTNSPGSTSSDTPRSALIVP